jgi:hypothetical protein
MLRTNGCSRHGVTVNLSFQVLWDSLRNTVDEEMTSESEEMIFVNQNYNRNCELTLTPRTSDRTIAMGSQLKAPANVSRHPGVHSLELSQLQIACSWWLPTQLCKPNWRHAENICPQKGLFSIEWVNVHKTDWFTLCAVWHDQTWFSVCQEDAPNVAWRCHCWKHYLVLSTRSDQIWANIRMLVMWV